MFSQWAKPWDNIVWWDIIGNQMHLGGSRYPDNSQISSGCKTEGILFGMAQTHIQTADGSPSQVLNHSPFNPFGRLGGVAKWPAVQVGTRQQLIYLNCRKSWAEQRSILDFLYFLRCSVESEFCIWKLWGVVHPNIPNALGCSVSFWPWREEEGIYFINYLLSINKSTRKVLHTTCLLFPALGWES